MDWWIVTTTTTTTNSHQEFLSRVSTEVYPTIQINQKPSQDFLDHMVTSQR